MTQEALKLALEALEGVLDNSPKVLEASISGGLYEVVQCRDAITAIREALAQPEQEHDAAIKTLEHLKYTYHGGQYWKPPLGKVKILAQPEERNFCSRCGKRTADLAAIHTCTPPQRTWVGLTDEEISALSKGHMTRNGFARNIEQALKAKNT